MKTFDSCIVSMCNIIYIAFCICIFCIPFIAEAQVRDDFSDGNFTHDPAWTGDTSQFEINVSGQLHLRSAGTDTSVLATRSSQVSEKEWSFWIKLSFNTSANNFARIYLTADTSILSISEKGYYLQLGGGDDSIFIMKQSGTAVEKIYSFKSYKTVHSTNTMRFKILCDSGGAWEAMIDTTGGYNYFSDGKFVDDSFRSSTWFGVFCRYTSSNASKIYFDDFYAGPVVQDTIAPEIISQEVIQERTVRLTFSETVQKKTAEINANYRFLSSGRSPDSARIDFVRPAEVFLFFNEALPLGFTDSLGIRNLMDLPGNRMRDTIVQICYYRPGAHDILISEIMADPDPPVELPDCEFIELYNRTQYPIDLKDWSLQYGGNSRLFPSLVIQPKGYILIAKDSGYQNYATCAFILTSSTSLSNSGTGLILKDEKQHVIHTVSYNPDWFMGSFKEEGGWSLEMIDPLNPCGCIENWKPAQDPSGGTPGRVNSVCKSNPDIKSPHLARALISDSSRLEVYFSEAMDSTSILSTEDWAISPFEDHPGGVMHPVKVKPVPPEFKSALLEVDAVFEKETRYLIHISGKMQDCAGNQCDTSLSTRAAIPDSVTCHDIIINEVLPDPVTGGARFVELYNRSEKTFDLKALVISDRDTADGVLPDAKPLFADGYLLFPGDYVVLTSNPAKIKEQYRTGFSELIVGMNGFPTFSDDTGTVTLARRDNLLIIDKMSYDPNLHYPLLVTKEGVSLERTNPDMPSGDRGNWHSAAETSGFATPGLQNSHRVNPGGPENEITIEPAIFSPDNDGINDLQTITIRENEPDYAVSILVYDSRGRLTRQLVNNVLQGSEGIFIWDGMTENRSRAPLGFYILLIELTRPDGYIKKIKKTVVLGTGF